MYNTNAITNHEMGADSKGLSKICTKNRITADKIGQIEDD